MIAVQISTVPGCFLMIEWKLMNILAHDCCFWYEAAMLSGSHRLEVFSESLAIDVKFEMTSFNPNEIGGCIKI